MNEPKPLPSETKLVERLRGCKIDVRGLTFHQNVLVPCCLLEEAATALASLADELRLAREDARRYRWARKQFTWEPWMGKLGAKWVLWLTGVPDISAEALTDDSVAQTLDAAIDEAIKDAASSGPKEPR